LRNVNRHAGRLLANLHGEPDTLRALARLAVQQTSLLADRQALANGKAIDEEDELIDVTFARQLIADIDAELADLAREQAILKRHCTATPKEIQATAKAYQREHQNAANAAVGRMLLWSLEKQLKKAKATVRRMRSG
jgi:hypothetical protein